MALCSQCMLNVLDCVCIPSGATSDSVSGVIEDLKARRVFGLAKYGKAVSGEDPSEDWLQHAYEEALDLCVYLRAELDRRKARA